MLIPLTKGIFSRLLDSIFRVAETHLKVFQDIEFLFLRLRTGFSIDGVATGPYLFHLDRAAAKLIGLPPYIVIELRERYVKILPFMNTAIPVQLQVAADHLEAFLRILSLFL